MAGSIRWFSILPLLALGQAVRAEPGPGDWAALWAPFWPSAFNVSIAVTPDGRRAAVTWLHNRSDTAIVNGSPTMYGAVGDPSTPSSFRAVAIGRQPFPNVAGVSETRKMYNWKHNAPLVFPRGAEGFFWLGLGMNALGYAQGLGDTGYAFVTGEANAATATWSTPRLARYAGAAGIGTLSELSGGMDQSGAIHVFGQGHVSNGDMAYARRLPGADAWETRALARAFRPGDLYYFGEGLGLVSARRNARGRNDLHLAFGWTERGSAPMFGLYYLRSADGGTSWKNARGGAVALPLRADGSDMGAAIARATLGTRRYDGAVPGIHGLGLAETASGAPLVTRLHLVAGTARAQARVYTFHRGAWLSVPVGGPYPREANGTGLAYNTRTGRVNVLLLDPGSVRRPARVVLFHQPLAALQAGKADWTEEQVAAVPNGAASASAFRVAVAPDTRFVAVVSPNCRFGHRVSPVIVTAALR